MSGITLSWLYQQGTVTIRLLNYIYKYQMRGSLFPNANSIKEPVNLVYKIILHVAASPEVACFH